MTAPLRNSGLPFIDDVAWGSHLCVFYETRDDLFEAVACYFEPGLQANELCVWRLPAGLSADDAHREMAARIDDFGRYHEEHRFDVLLANGLDRFDEDAFEQFWSEKIDRARANGFEGLRGCGDSDILTQAEQQIAYEEWLHAFLDGKPALALCTYSLAASRALDVFDVVRAHNVTAARRGGEWQFMEAPELQRVTRIRGIDDALAAVSAPFPRRELLTERERMVLAYLVKGASSKEAGRELGVSPRTIDFHRANIIEKLGARNTAEVVAHVLAGR